MLNTNSNFFKNTINLFPENYLNSLIKDKKEFTFKKGELICTAEKSNKCFFIIKEGYICNFHIYIDGKECITGLLSSGDILGLTNVFSNKKNNIFSRALTDVKVISISDEKFKTLVKQDSLLAMSLLNYFSETNHDMIETLEQISYGTVENRLVFLFKKLINFEEENNGWYPISVSLTHKDIAGMIGSSRETVTMNINKLLKDGVIKRIENIIWIQL
ncbi:Crp/Fnr family transcriptional regulator [Clostridium sp. SHJSY1]|uniref:Crp/Fnr family transcriptional regulator n=1 Tax=Clostridium sp. SHJSY1 TaxID=2942483 RepID=UPI0028758FBA|nr:Crp/Fnr family transcriptional regulator [Clostridium sp. SHJSY1]MDS0528357.1 Crp/Fnr family transcriptional regulator [Clostridium sp. SHJSY1]